MGADQRRPGQRSVCLARRRRHLDVAGDRRAARRASVTRSRNGLPAKASGARSASPIAPSNSQRVYALIEAEKGGLFRSDDGGENWRLVNDTRPASPAGLVLLARSPSTPPIRTWSSPERAAPEEHRRRQDVQPRARACTTATRTTSGSTRRTPNRMICSNDGGVDITTDGGEDVVRAAAADLAVLPRHRPIRACRIA